MVSPVVKQAKRSGRPLSHTLRSSERKVRFSRDAVAASSLRRHQRHLTLEGLRAVARPTWAPRTAVIPRAGFRPTRPATVALRRGDVGPKATIGADHHVTHDTTLPSRSELFRPSSIRLESEPDLSRRSIGPGPLANGLGE